MSQLEHFNPFAPPEVSAALGRGEAQVSRAKVQADGWGLWSFDKAESPL
jgi:hypothetical protein